MRFEKWQALGNDYVIVEATELPFDLTPPRVRLMCEPHTGIGSDGILLLDSAFVGSARRTICLSKRMPLLFRRIGPRCGPYREHWHSHREL